MAIQLGQAVIDDIAKCQGSMLVFGAGYDSGLWARRGAIILETDPAWMGKVKTMYPEALVYPWSSGPPASCWEEPSPDKPVELPEQIQNSRFDVILVDGPMGGYHDTTQEVGPLGLPTSSGRSPDPGTGRMGALFTALSLSKPTTVIFVDDFERPIEHRWAERLLATKFPVRRLFFNDEGKVSARYSAH